MRQDHRKAPGTDLHFKGCSCGKTAPVVVQVVTVREEGALMDVWKDSIYLKEAILCIWLLMGMCVHHLVLWYLVP